MRRASLAAVVLVVGIVVACSGGKPEGSPGFCGDGTVNTGELCDDGNDVQTDGCTSRCAPETCGDGYVQGVEVCDDGNETNTDACLTSCAAAVCGDGYVQDGVEACDAGPGGSGACRADCTAHVCGDGEVGAAEQCDDGNVDDGDGCSAACTITTGWCCIDKTTCFQAGANPANPCQLCEPATSNTSWTATSGAVACDDGIFCNGSDSCGEGDGSCSVHTGSPCGGATPGCLEAADQCVQCTDASHCNDGNACTADACSGTTCQHAPAVGAPCSDGLFCNGADTCAADATCSVHGSDPCPGAVCRETTDSCGPTCAEVDCDDQTFCTTDTCLNGVCRNTWRPSCIEP